MDTIYPVATVGVEVKAVGRWEAKAQERNAPGSAIPYIDPTRES